MRGMAVVSLYTLIHVVEDDTRDDTAEECSLECQLECMESPSWRGRARCSDRVNACA